MALFRHFFYPRIGKEGWLGGGVMFCFRPNVKKAYPEMVVKSKWDEWRNGWFLVVIPEALQHLQEPTEHPVSQELWRSPSQQDVYLSAAVSRFKLLREQGVSGAAIIAHALRNHLAPLQKRPHPA